MKKNYIAVTYDVCEHNNLHEAMNEYRLDMNMDIEKQLSEFATKDIAPLVKVFESGTGDSKVPRLYKAYYFYEYECNCNK